MVENPLGGLGQNVTCIYPQNIPGSFPVAARVYPSGFADSFTNILCGIKAADRSLYCWVYLAGAGYDSQQWVVRFRCMLRESVLSVVAQQDLIKPTAAQTNILDIKWFGDDTSRCTPLFACLAVLQQANGSMLQTVGSMRASLFTAGERTVSDSLGHALALVWCSGTNGAYSDPVAPAGLRVFPALTVVNISASGNDATCQTTLVCRTLTRARSRCSRGRTCASSCSCAT